MAHPGVLVLLVLVAAATAPQGALGARILALLPFPGTSHFIVTSSLVRELALKGHEVHVVSPFKIKSPPANYTEITIPNTMNQIGEPADMFKMSKMSPPQLIMFLWSFGESSCRTMLSDPAVQGIMKEEGAHYDLILIEAFLNECFLGFAHLFRAPIVQVCTFGTFSWMGDWVGNPNNPSYDIDPLLHYVGTMSFTQRLINTAFGVGQRLGRHFYYLPRIDAIMREAFADPTMPSVSELERNTSLILVNSHYSLTPPRATVPAFVQVGGLHVQAPKPLPADLKAWLDAATDGFIYFSLGSVVRSADMPEEKRDAFIQALSGLKQRVLWKWEEDAPPGLPKNMRLGKWLPQQDVLAHPNLRLFITHGGLGSTVEALYHGVPLLGIPVFAEQGLNVRRAEAAGYALALPFAEVSRPRLEAALARLLGEPAFRDNARLRSAHFHDRPRPPMQEALFWTEYVLRHRGAPHLRSAALDLGWAQLLLLDVGAALGAAAALAGAAVALAACALVRCLRRPRPGQRGKPKAKPAHKRD